MEYSSKAINQSLVRLLAEKTKNDFEKFLIQQNLIQYQLISLVVLRSNAPDKHFVEWMDDRTLGNLIPLYKICAAKDSKERLLIKSLEQYNKERRYLVHKILKASDFKDVETKANSTNKIGIKIINQLERLLSKAILDSFAGLKSSTSKPKEKISTK